MLIAIIVLSILLVLSLAVIVMIGIDDKWRAIDWFATLCFIFCLPLWLTIRLINSFRDK